MQQGLRSLKEKEVLKLTVRPSDTLGQPGLSTRGAASAIKGYIDRTGRARAVKGGVYGSSGGTGVHAGDGEGVLRALRRTAHQLGYCLIHISAALGAGEEKGGFDKVPRGKPSTSKGQGKRKEKIHWKGKRVDQARVATTGCACLRG